MNLKKENVFQTPARGGEIDEPMSLGELCDPKERSVDTRSPLLGVTGSWKSDGPDEEGESAIPEPPSSSRRWEAKTSKSPGAIGWAVQQSSRRSVL